MSFTKPISISFYKFLIISVFVGIFLFSNITIASTTDGTIDSTYKYVWGENTGWINFGCSNCNVHITDSALTGYAWSENYGWINLNPAANGVKNNNEGTLSGYAWGENLGWIDFSSVRINSSGVFSGTASSTVSGQISFDCSRCQVKTDWRPQSTRSAAVSPGGGGLFSASSNQPVLPLSVAINNGDEYTTSRFVTLNLQAGADVGTMVVSNYPDFSNASQETYVPVKSWDVCSQRPASVACPVENTFYTVYVKFYAKQGGQSSESLSNSIVYVKEIPKKSFIERLPEILQPFIPEFLKPKKEEIKPPEIPLEELLPKEAPSAFKTRWILLDPKAIGRLVFTPLPNEIKVLAQKIPKLQETFSAVGIMRMTDLEKLKKTSLSLPGLTESAGLPTVAVEPGKFTLPKMIPLSQLTLAEKRSLPSEIIFARAGGEMIDYNISLSLTAKGETQQAISVLAGRLLNLAIKPEEPVNSVKGYIVFKSKKTVAEGKTLRFSLNSSLTASLLFGKPEFASVSLPKNFVPAEGVELASLDSIFKKISGNSDTEQKLVLAVFEYSDSDGDGIYTAQIQAPVVDGEYEIVTVMDYKNPALGMKEITLITVIDPEGYIYEKKGDKETRIPGAIVSLYWLNSEIKQYELWPAKEYQQDNPQTTDLSGTYAFIVPEGYYYLKVDAPGYLAYDGKPFQVKEGSGVHINIELNSKYWLLKAIDWKTVILVVTLLLLIYNFYRDRIRNKTERKI